MISQLLEDLNIPNPKDGRRYSPEYRDKRYRSGIRVSLSSLSPTYSFALRYILIMHEAD